MVTPKSNKKELYLIQSFQTTPFATYMTRTIPMHAAPNVLLNTGWLVSHGLFEDAYHM